MSDDTNAKSIKQRSWLTRLTDILSREPKDREDLVETLRDAEERELLSPEMLGMIESVLQVSEMQVREVMVPRSQTVSVEDDSTLETLLPIVADSGHSRFPVWNGAGNDVIGILLAKDLLSYFFQKKTQEFRLKDIMRPATFTPQSKRLDILLKEFRINRNHMAIVIDEYGHVAGLVTIEDVLEQIVGDIEDEYDVDEDYIKKFSDISYTVKAATPIDDFNEYFNTDFNDSEFDTIGGFITKELGHIPKRGESIDFGDYRFKVLHSDNRRIYLFEVKKTK